MNSLSRIFRPDPKPARRFIDPAAGREKVQRQGCRICGRVGRLREIDLGQPLYPNIATRHHLVPRSLGGGDVVENIVGLCGHGTAGHHGLIESRDRATCSVLRSLLTESELAYIIEKKGEDFLARYYPEPRA